MKLSNDEKASVAGLVTSIATAGLLFYKLNFIFTQPPADDQRIATAAYITSLVLLSLALGEAVKTFVKNGLGDSAPPPQEKNRLEIA